MTALPAPRTLAGATSLERALLRAASAVDLLITARLEQRGAVEHRRVQDARSLTVAARGDAVARGSLGMLPR